MGRDEHGRQDGDCQGRQDGYSQEHSRIALAFAQHPQRKNIIDGLVQVGASWKQGWPPKGAMERALEEWLAELLSE